MVLRFEQATGLDADPAPKPAVETFDVRGAGGARIAGTAGTVNAATKTGALTRARAGGGAGGAGPAVTVNAATKPVELTRARAVAHNERVTVTYTDPTPN